MPRFLYPPMHQGTQVVSHPGRSELCCSEHGSAHSSPRSRGQFFLINTQRRLLGGMAIPGHFWRNLHTAFIFIRINSGLQRFPVQCPCFPAWRSLVIPPSPPPLGAQPPSLSRETLLSLHTAFSSSQPPLLPGSYSSQYPPYFFDAKFSLPFPCNTC